MGTDGSKHVHARASALLALVASLVTSVAAPAASRSPAAQPAPTLSGSGEPASRTVVLVAIDGVRWQEVFGGVDPKLAAKKGLEPDELIDAARLVPNLHRLITTDGAAIGAPPSTKIMRASGPNYVSLPGYIEMLTGRRDTWCGSNHCGDVRHPTIVDDVASHGGIAAVVASWPGILHAASAVRGRAAMSIGRTGGENLSDFENDFAVAALLGDGETIPSSHAGRDFRSDAKTGSIACAYLESHRPTLLFVGLGETDAYAHQGNYRAYLRALHQADDIVGRLADEVATLNAEGHPSTLMVTTDHGRSYAFATHGGKSPESARVWLVATGAGIQARGPTSSAVPRHLSDVSQTLRRILGLPIVQSSTAGRVMTELFVAPGTVATR
ncbi:MAG TPA: hypothetical protein VHC69_03625 [Polyangiaceae bacterium]|nr:hypothetical protein [Polyangiaceae bacterium]